MQNRPVALVTGASRGIGAAFARSLASRQHDLVVVARDRNRLDALAKEIGASGVEVEVLSADLTVPDELGAVEKRVLDPIRPVDVLINNAAYATAGPFHELTVDEDIRQIQLNVLALVRLTHAALSQMVPRQSGRVLNVSSMEGFLPVPNLSTYSASKAYVISFTEAVHEEVASRGVRVTCLCPGLTRTEFQERAGFDVSGTPAFLWMSAESVAEAGLDSLDRNVAVCAPGLHNRAAVGFLRVAPRGFQFIERWFLNRGGA